MADFTRLITNKNSIDLACRVRDDIQEQLMSMAVEAAVREQKCLDVSRIDKSSESTELSTGDLLDLVGLYISLIRLFMETDEKQFHATLASVGFSGAFICKFPLKHKNEAVSVILNRGQGGIQKLSSFKWRVDISFTCGLANARVPPKVIISLVLKDSQKYVFEVDLHTFHRLRFNIALAFKEFINLKNSNVLKNKMLI